MVLGLLLGALATYSSIIAFNLPVTAFGINPPDQESTIPITIQVVLPINESHIVADVMLDIVVTYTQPLVANRNATLFAAATLQTPFAMENIAIVIVGFQFSDQWPLTYYNNHTAIPTWVYLGAKSEANTSMTSRYNASLFWPTAEISPPYVTVIFNAGLPSYYNSYPEYALTVQPISELQSERANRVNVGLTVALVGFSLVEGISNLYDYLTEKETKTNRVSLY